MYTTFTDWESGLYLEHHGIKGMKWGVRRYQNEDGSLTTLGKARYGLPGTGASARKMQRDFNRLDQGYANVEAERQQAGRQVNKYANKIMRRAGKKVANASGEDVDNFMKTDRRIKKYAGKMQKAGQTLKMTEQQKAAIENLQMRIIANAADKGYTVKSKEVLRIGNTQRQRVNAMLASAAIGGAVGGAIVGGSLAANGTRVWGQKVKIRKNGDGKQELVNYANLNHRNQSDSQRANRVKQLETKKQNLEKSLQKDQYALNELRAEKKVGGQAWVNTKKMQKQAQRQYDKVNRKLSRLQ